LTTLKNQNYATCATSARCVWPTLPTVQAGRACRVLPGHVLGAGGLPLLDAQVGNVERRTGVHVVRAELVAQRPVPFRTRQRQVVQLEFVALVPAGSDDLLLASVRECTKSRFVRTK
jgi:hypothetical protein